tara:strand:+ start:1590 stop:2366 length:777 start_codon:yes stop_codon:yes gene_type:complete
MKLSLEPFERFDLLPLSFSRINKFVTDRPGFYISYIHKYKGSSCAMERGTWAEHGVLKIFEGMSEEDAIKDALYYFDKAVEEKKLEDDPKRSTERTNIPLYIKGFWKELKQFELEDFQEKQESKILDIPIIGYTDFGLLTPIENIYFKVDLKSSGRMPSKLTNSVSLQQSYYTSTSNVENKVLYSVVSRGENKTKWFNLENTATYQRVFRDMIISMHSFLSKCEDKEEMKKLIVPDLDNWIWNYDPKVTKIRKEIWGY